MTGFTAALVPAVYPEFPKMDDMVGKRVRVTGDLETYKKKSVIKVTRATQVKTMKTPKATEKKKAS
jgi:DNA/RNA endonuclease YhcR with UshA esterase domain